MSRKGLRQIDISSLVYRNFPATRLSFLYANHHAKSRLAGLYDLLATVEECLYQASDHQVSRAKLNWWLEELHAARKGTGTHPLSVRLATSGALKMWPEYLLKRFFSLALYRVDAGGLSTEVELLDLSEAIGSIHLELECALHDQPVSSHSTIKQLAAANGQMQLLRESLWAKQPSYYWVPLTVCAQLNLKRQQMADNSGAKPSHLWIAEIAQLTLGNCKLEGSGSALAKRLTMVRSYVNPHWLIFSFLQQRQLQRILKCLDKTGPAEKLVDQVSQLRFLDSWASWQLARLLNRDEQK